MKIELTDHMGVKLQVNPKRIVTVSDAEAKKKGVVMIVYKRKRSHFCAFLTMEEFLKIADHNELTKIYMATKATERIIH